MLIDVNSVFLILIILRSEIFYFRLAILPLGSVMSAVFGNNFYPIANYNLSGLTRYFYSFEGIIHFNAWFYDANFCSINYVRTANKYIKNIKVN